MTTQIAICVGTCRRPEGLRELLASLCRIERRRSWQLELRVVENDDRPRAQALVETIALVFPGAVRYALERERNVARVRNRAVDMGPADLVAFVDDDEVVDPRWLVELVETYETQRADAVFGPVRRTLPEQAPDWIRRGGFFHGEEPAGELPWQAARTGNALVDGRWFYAEGFRFDVDYGRSGGEDAHLFARLQQAGARLVANPLAVVAEPVEPNRLAFGWLWRRTWRSAETYHRITHELPDPPSPALQAVKRLARAGWLGLRGLPGAVRGRPEGVAAAALSVALAGGGLRAWLRPVRVESLPQYGS